MHESYITMNRESLDHRISRTNTTLPNGRSSHQRFSVINGGLRSFAKFTGKYLCQSLFFNKVAVLRPATLFKKRIWQMCFSVSSDKFLRTPFLQNTSGRLFLFVSISKGYFLYLSLLW